MAHRDAVLKGGVHTIIPDGSYRESILSFGNSQHPVDSWKMSSSFIQYNVHTVFGVAGFRPGRRGPFVSAKGPKTIDALSAIWDGTDANLRSAPQLASLKQGPRNDRSVRPRGQPAGVGH